MTYGEVESYIKHMNPNELVNLCNDIYKFKYVTEKLKPDCSLNILAENLQCWDVRYIEDVVIRVAAQKFNDVVLLLMKSMTHQFIK